MTIDMTLTELVEKLDDLQKLYNKKMNAEKVLVKRVKRLTQQDMSEKVENTLIYAGRRTPAYQKIRDEFKAKVGELRDILTSAGLTKEQVAVLTTMKESS